MNKTHFLILMSCLFISITGVQAQKIKGKIEDSDKQPIEYATVVMQTADSIYIKATVTDSLGQFYLPEYASTYRLIVQHLLYNTFEQLYPANQNDITIALTEKTNTLKEITINGRKPIIKVTGGKISYEISSLLAGKAISNAYETLLQLPGVREDNKVLTLAGSNKLTIMINGKVSTMSYDNLVSLLKSYPSDKVKNAEIMYSTPPEYHVRGASINLILEGYEGEQQLKGQLNANYNQNYYGNFNTGGSLLYATKKMTVDFNYSFSKNHSKSGLNLYSHHTLQDKLYEIEQHNNGSSKSDDHNMRLSTTYQPSKNDKLNLVYNTQITSSYHAIEKSTGTYSNSLNNKREFNPIQLHDLLLDYTSTKGFSSGIEYSTYHTHQQQHFQELETSKAADFLEDAKQNVNKIRLYADRNKSFSNDWSLKYGGQYLYTNDHSTVFYQTQTGDDKSKDNSDSKLYETTANAYLGFGGNIGSKFSFEASFSGEYYKIGSYKEWTLFPTLSATYTLSPGNIFQFSLSSNREYPDYWTLHGATGYLNGYEETQGNANLKPYKNYSTQLTYILKNKYSFTLYSNYEDNYFIQLPYQSPDNLTFILQTVNFDYDYRAGLSISLPFRIGNAFDTRFDSQLEYIKVKDSHFHDISFEKEKLNLYASLNNTIHLAKRPKIDLTLNGLIFTNGLQGPGVVHVPERVDAGVKWSFSHDKGELQLKGYDLFNTWNPTMTTRFATQDYKMNISFYEQSLALSFVWKFNGYKTSEHKKIDTSRYGTK
jgi:hypothetical protein